MKKMSYKINLLFAGIAVLTLLFNSVSAQTINTFAGNHTGFAGDGGLATAPTVAMNYVYDVTTDNRGNFYICDWNNNRIRKVNAAGVISTVVGSGASIGSIGDGG